MVGSGLVDSFFPSPLDAIILLSCVNRVFRLHLTHALSKINIVWRCLSVTNPWVCFHFCPVPKIRWSRKWGSSVNFWKYKLTKRKERCPLGKTDPYMSPSGCLCFVPCLLQPQHLCPGTAITGRTPLSAMEWLPRMAQRCQPRGKGVGIRPYAACVECRNWGVLAVDCKQQCSHI